MIPTPNHHNWELYTYCYSRDWFPQGEICSAKLWIIAFNEAIEMINEYGITGQGFADDCGPMIGYNNSHEMYKSIQRMLNMLLHWGQRKNLNFNPTKTIAVL